MCGIAGAFDLTGRREFSRERLLRMTRAIAHRGPDEEQIHLEPGVALGTRRLAIIDVQGGSQPLSNESGDIWVSYEGELYDYEQSRRELLERGHVLATRCDTEVWVHRYEDVGERVFEKARGQFSVALWDRCQRTLLLARDRVGIGPLFYAQQDGWLLWCSEIKGILASGMIEAEPDPRAIDYVFNFFSMPTERTCFRGIRQIAPGYFLRAQEGRGISLHQYWDLDFPERGYERQFRSADEAAEELEHLLRTAVRRRLVSEVPLSCYLSGGLDSTMVLALSCQERGQPVPSFTIGLDHAGPADERHVAAESAGMFGSKQTVVNITQDDIARTYPRVIEASEGPVIDTSCACMVLLAAANRAAGNTVALTGEGADEALAGYIWYKPPLPGPTKWILNPAVERVGRYAMLSGLIGGNGHRPKFAASSGLRLPQQYSWEICGQSREWLYSADMWDRLNGWSAYDDMKIPIERAKRWHPLNQALYVGYKAHMPGLLLAGKGDRAIRSASTEGRYPFLDEDVVHFCSQLPPSYKLRGMTDKWLLRQLAGKLAPTQIKNRRKQMFRSTMSPVFLRPNRPAWVDQLLSDESLRATGYFDPRGVRKARDAQLHKSRYSLQRFSLDLGLAGVVSTQLWHHFYCGGGLADLPTWSAPERLNSLDRRPVAVV